MSPSAAALNPNAAEFVPTSFAAEAEAAAVEPASVPPPLATVQPRQSSEEPAIMPSTSSGVTASVAPTLKRPRESEAELEDESAKKAREEPVAEIVLSSSDEDEEEEITDVEVEDEEENVDEDVKTESEDEFEGGEIEGLLLSTFFLQQPFVYLQAHIMCTTLFLFVFFFNFSLLLAAHAPPKKMPKNHPNMYRTEYFFFALEFTQNLLLPFLDRPMA